MQGVVRKSSSPKSPRRSPRSRSPRAPSVLANLPGRLPKGKISPTSYVPPRPHLPDAHSGSDQSPSRPELARSSRSTKGHKSRERSKRLKAQGSREFPISPKGHELPFSPASPKPESPMWYESSEGHAFFDGANEALRSPSSPSSPAGISGAPSPSRGPRSPGSSSPIATSRHDAQAAAGSGVLALKAERPALLIEEPSAPERPNRIKALYGWLKRARASSECWRSPARTAPSLNLDSDAVLPKRRSAGSVSSPHRKRVLARKSRTASDLALRKSSFGLDLCTVLLVVVAVVLAALVAWVVIRGTGHEHPRALEAGCTSATCLRYQKLFEETLDEDANPCEDFYHYVCGPARPAVYRSTWRDNLRSVAKYVTTAYRYRDRGSFREARPTFEDEAVSFIGTCLSPLNRDNVPEVREVLKDAGLPWPSPSRHPDVIESIFYMSRHVYQPIFVDVTLEEQQGQSVLRFMDDDRFKSVYEKIEQHINKSYIKDHFCTTYAVFAPDTDSGHCGPLYDEFYKMKSFLDTKTARTDSGATGSHDAMPVDKFLSLTALVPEGRWDGATRRYLNSSLRSASDVVMQSRDHFRALFELHRVYGEDKMADFLGWFAVQVLLPYTNLRLLVSYYRLKSEAFREQWNVCATDGFMIFAYALDSIMLRHAQPAILDVNRLEKLVKASFARLLGSKESPLEGDALPVPAGERLHEALDIVRASKNWSVLADFYSDFPNVEPAKPLRNKMNFTNFLAGKVKHLTGGNMKPYDTYTDTDPTVFEGWRMNSLMLNFPWYVPDAHLALLLGGLGMRLAGVTYLDYAERGNNSYEEVLQRNRGCLSPQLNETDRENFRDIVAATAAIHVVWDVFKHELSAKGSSPRWKKGSQKDVPPPFTEESLLFAFGCWLSCGDPVRGRALCNVPLKNSPYFAKVYGCPPAAPMYPEHKCRIRI